MKTNRAFMGFILILSMFAFIVSADDECCSQNTIRVIGAGQLSVNADIATIYAYVTTVGKTVNDAVNNAQAVLNAVESSLKQNKVSQSDISTSYLSVYPTYDYTTGTGVINGYTVYISLTVVIRGINTDQKRVGNVIQGLANAGVSSISGITYDSSNPQAGISSARKAAVANALKKANEYAAIAGGKLTRILKIDQSNVAYYPYSTNNILGNSSLGLASTGSGITSSPNSGIQLPVGKVSIIVNVLITWVVVYSK